MYSSQRTEINGLVRVILEASIADFPDKTG